MSTITNLTPWGYHGIFDCAGCDSLAIKNEATIRAGLTELATIAANSPESEAFVSITGHGSADTEGFSAVQLLNTGSITVNFVNNSCHAYFDVFSHKEFSVTEVESCIKKHFGNGISVNKIFLPRNAGAVAPN